MSGRIPRRPSALAVLASAAGALVAVVLGFLTFGAQATAGPDGIPVAVAAPESGPLRAAAEQVARQGGERLSWQVTTVDQGRTLLEDKEVYGVLELTGGPQGPEATVVVSGAINPSGTQVAKQALTGAGRALTTDGTAQVAVENVHPAAPVVRVAPLAVSALAWIGCLAAGAILTLLAARGSVRLGAGARLLQIGGVTVLITAVLAGFLELWNSSLPVGWEVLGFIALTAAGFAAVQAGLLRLLGLKAMAVLGPFYLVAPAVAGQVPEMLDPVYRTLLWSWTPFRFSTEGVRSLLAGATNAPDVRTGIWVLTGMLAVGLVLVLVPVGRASVDRQRSAVDVERSPAAVR